VTARTRHLETGAIEFDAKGGESLKPHELLDPEYHSFLISGADQWSIDTLPTIPAFGNGYTGRRG